MQKLSWSLIFIAYFRHFLKKVSSNVCGVSFDGLRKWRKGGSRWHGPPSCGAQNACVVCHQAQWTLTSKPHLSSHHQRRHHGGGGGGGRPHLTERASMPTRRRSCLCAREKESEICLPSLSIYYALCVHKVTLSFGNFKTSSSFFTQQHYGPKCK